MKIGINASFLRKQNTGIGQVTVNFINKLAEIKDNKNQFILYLEEDVDLKLPDNFKKVIFLPSWKRDDLIRKIWWEKFLLPKKIEHDRCDIFLSLYQSTTILHNMVKHVMVVHDIIPKLFPEYLNNWRKRLYQRLTEKAIKKTNKILAVSHRTEKDLIQHLGIDPQKITASYIDVDPIYKKDIDDSEKNRILEKYALTKGYIYSGGGLEVRKNTEGVLRAYKALKETYGHASWLPKLVVSGKMMPRLAPLVTDVAALVKELNLEKDVVLLDWVPQADLPALYSNASLFIYPSHYEGFGIPVLEAMNQGIPTITARTSSLPEVGVDAVLYVNPADIEEIGRVMRKILTDEKMHETLSRKGRERGGHFSWDKFLQKFINIINA
jgi:glycosyltransferase involved in cell wall biosynthesis